VTKRTVSRSPSSGSAEPSAPSPQLLRIPGIGESKRRLLLTTFGSLQAIREATAEQIGALPGFSVKSGQRILDALRASDAIAPAAATPSAAAPDTAETAASEPAPSADQPVMQDDTPELASPSADTESR